MLGSTTSTKTTCTLSTANVSAGIIILSTRALLTPIVILITNEGNSELKIRYTKLRYWINNVLTFLHEKTLKHSVVNKKTVEKEANELEKI